PSGICVVHRRSISAGLTPPDFARAVDSSPRRSVAVYPGHTLFTSTLCGAYSFERLFTNPTTAARTEFERIRLSTGCFTVSEVIVINLPHRRSRIPGKPARARYRVLI